MKLLRLFPVLALLMVARLEAADPNAPIRESDYSASIKLACVGDSITAGSGTTNRQTDAYPAQLQRLLGEKWSVGNFGLSARTLLNAGDHPYQTTGPLKEALAFGPDVVIIMLGTNDSKPQNWKFKSKFVADYKELIGKFKALPGKPRIFICKPVRVVGPNQHHIDKAAVEDELPRIDQIAKAENVVVIDMHAALKGHDDLLPDGVHPNTAGANLLALAAYQALTGKSAALEKASHISSR